MNEVTKYLDREIDHTTAAKIAQLSSRVFGTKVKSLQKRIERILTAGDDPESESYESRRFVIWHEGQAVAHSRWFPRTIKIGIDSITILALATVCVSPEHRHLKLGSQVVKAAFQAVDEGIFKFSLFQTGVPKFYEQLGCQLIDNPVINSLHHDEPNQNPFWEPSVMVYPDSPSFPAGTIDLLGEGF